jgi:hypothetical protein
VVVGRAEIENKLDIGWRIRRLLCLWLWLGGCWLLWHRWLLGWPFRLSIWGGWLLLCGLGAFLLDLGCGGTFDLGGLLGISWLGRRCHFLLLNSLLGLNYYFKYSQFLIECSIVF